MTTFNLNLDEKRETATLSINEHPLVFAPMDAQSLSNMIAMFCHVRAQMAPEIPINWTSNDPVQAAMDPSWNLVQETMHGGSLLHLRDPGHGWLHFYFPPERAEMIAEQLKKQAEAVRAEAAAALPSPANVN